MSVRESIGRSKGLGYGAAGVLVLAGVVGIAYQFSGPATGAAAFDEAQAFFTADDGKTWFKAGVSNVSPFAHEGKTAVRAHVFQAGGVAFVGYMERYTEEARKVIAAAPKGGNEASRKVEMSGRQVKRPGDKDWVPALSGAGARVTQVKAPGGKEGSVEVVEP